MAMELNEFVDATITQIFSGIKKAQQKANGSNGQIAPDDKSMFGAVGSHKYTDFGVVQEIEFDVAVTTTEVEGKKGGAGVFIAPIGLGAQRESGQSNQSVSRIRFIIPVVYPRSVSSGAEV